MLKILCDPRLFNFLIIAMFAFAAVRWALEKNWPQVGYWAGAVILNVAVTFMGSK